MKEIQGKERRNATSSTDERFGSLLTKGKGTRAPKKEFGEGKYYTLRLRFEKNKMATYRVGPRRHRGKFNARSWK